MKRPLRQALQTKQWPPCQPTPTRSPFCHSVTPAPTFSTRPAISWPGIRGSFRPGNAPPLTMTSLWQTPHASTLMRIWPESGSRIGLDQIKEGDQVRASFDASGNQASKIEVTSKQKAGDKSEMKTQSKDK